MLLLLDENLPKRLKQDFPEHKIFTTKERGWSGIKNGELLVKLLENNFVNRWNSNTCQCAHCFI